MGKRCRDTIRESQVSHRMRADLGRRIGYSHLPKRDAVNPAAPPARQWLSPHHTANGRGAKAKALAGTGTPQERAALARLT
ncbi:hypothetical protein MHIB_35430 [Mycolicibacter hiberniae]|uniref:Uncharacterized protein n=1 Tax=Mycolicibacter hiberniae TaxID=29314 RepID=A0A7I7X7A9_9MYCO|nr:hypothetical protein MHIB_35430 [Mycolicibacter hiberniae]